MISWLHRVDVVLLRLSWVPSIIMLIALLMVVIQAADREAPFRVLSVEPAFARPGEIVTIRASVWRDVSRNCAAVMSRSLFDAHHVRWDYPITRFSDEMIDGMEKRAPGELLVSVMVPLSASPGAANLVSVLEYRCNRVHALWPIEVTTNLPFQITK